MPVTVVEKTPSGSGDVPIDEIVGGTLLISVTVAVLCPVAFFAVTVSVPAAGITAGAVYKPLAVTVPETAAQDGRAGRGKLLGRSEDHCSLCGCDHWSRSAATTAAGRLVPATGTTSMLPNTVPEFFTVTVVL